MFHRTLGQLSRPKSARRKSQRLPRRPRPALETLEGRLCLSGDLLVLSFNSNSILDFNGVTGAFQKTFPTPPELSGPSGITIGPDSNVYVSARNTSTVLRFALESRPAKRRPSESDTPRGRNVIPIRDSA